MQVCTAFKFKTYIIKILRQMKTSMIGTVQIMYKAIKALSTIFRFNIALCTYVCMYIALLLRLTLSSPDNSETQCVMLCFCYVTHKTETNVSQARSASPPPIQGKRQSKEPERERKVLGDSEGDQD